MQFRLTVPLMQNYDILVNHHRIVRVHVSTPNAIIALVLDLMQSQLAKNSVQNIPLD